MDNVIYQASDLASSKRVEFIRDARAGRARLPDKDGTSLVMLPEARLAALEEHAYWSRAHQRVGSLYRAGWRPSIEELGDLAWMRTLDPEDVAVFLDELQDALVTGLADESTAAIDETVNAWRVTARQLTDPLRRCVLTEPTQLSDFSEIAPDTRQA